MAGLEITREWVAGVGLLAGIGFTVSLFITASLITHLAFDDPVIRDDEGAVPPRRCDPDFARAADTGRRLIPAPGPPRRP